ncbi:hypothetical protein BASA81_000340 [Batrachochytrium salamandrivorans]|nr:hypothetical protein BASA81_000340 [Batrachochytrium salamandrivorans]
MAAMVKLLAWPAYRSTDFSVHAHWLFITSRMPPSEWYREQTSRWTLDYPPVFAWFEYALGRVFLPPPPSLLGNLDEPFACFRNPTPNTPECFSNEAVIWHRVSVAGTELLMLSLGVFAFCRTWPESSDNAELKFTPRKQLAAAVLVGFDPNLLLVDHIHFQYNGVLLGVLLLSIASIRAERDFLAALLFALLLCFKHIFIYAAPLYFVYLFRRSIRFTPTNGFDWRYFLYRMAGLGSIVVSVFAFAMFSVCGVGDGRAVECVKAMGSRLFPVGERGLLHAYWAPNFWALYATADKLLKVTLVGSASTSKATSSLGLVAGVVEFDVLPTVPVYETVFLSVMGMIPALFKVWQCPHPQLFLHAYVVCVLAFFLFGFHVHEKALLMASVPLALSALDSTFDANAYLCLACTTFVALCPLLFVVELTPIKLLLGLGFALLAGVVLDGFHTESKRERRIAHTGLAQSLFVRSKVRALYLGGLMVVLGVYESGVVPRWRPKLEFLPLMLVSAYCAVGVLGCWIELYVMLDRKQCAIESYSNM